MSALDQYFAETGENASKLAERMGVSPSAITRPLRGERNASMNLAMKVEAATGGRVTAVAFLDICLAAKRARAAEVGAEESELAQ